MFRNLLHNVTYNPSVISWVDEVAGCFKINNTVEFAATWGRMKSNRWVSEKTVIRLIRQTALYKLVPDKRTSAFLELLSS